MTEGLTIADAVHKENCKLVAFLDKNLSDAAVQNVDEHFKRVNTIGGV